MLIFTFASGSGGNCALVTDGGTRLLIDAGISARRIETALAGLGGSVEALDAVLITHEHSDHIGGLQTLIKHHNVPIYAPRTVAGCLRRTVPGVEDCLNAFDPGDAFTLGSITVTSFPTPHDASQSVGYRLDGSSALGFCTDLGQVTEEVLSCMLGTDAAVIESNHDENLLLSGRYPVSLKRRILSQRGHLSNECSGALAVSLARAGARKIVLAHLSRENNRPELASRAVLAALAAEKLSPELYIAPESGILRVEI